MRFCIENKTAVPSTGVIDKCLASYAEVPMIMGQTIKKIVLRNRRATETFLVGSHTWNTAPHLTIS